MKRCFNCKKTLPLFLFTTNPRKYQRPDQKGKNLVCRKCTFKSWKQDKYAWVVNPETNKFEKIEFKSKWEIFKHLYFRK